MLLLEDWTYYTYFFWFVSSCPTNIIIMNINITIMTPFFSGEGAKYIQTNKIALKSIQNIYMQKMIVLMIFF